MSVARYPLRGIRELRTTIVGDRIFLAVHSGDRCSSGPLAMPAKELPVLLLALEDLAEALCEAANHTRCEIESSAEPSPPTDPETT